MPTSKNFNFWHVMGVLGLVAVSLGVVGCNDKEEAAAPDAAAPVPATAQPAASAKPVASKPAPVKEVARAAEPVKAKQATPAPKPVCTNCATVQAVTAVEREGEAGGGGAVAGALLGGVVGNQIGQGDGKNVATVVGAIGGGLVGHQVEKNMKKTTVYQISLQLDDGKSKMMELADAGPLKAGARVRIDGNNLVPLPAGK